MNIVILLTITYALSLIVAWKKTGRLLVSTKVRNELLDVSDCKEFDCRGFKDFNTAKRDWRKIGDDRPCFLTNPLYGYYNTCGNGVLGLSKETPKEKLPYDLRVLLLGGSQANNMAIVLEGKLREAVNTGRFPRFKTATVFSAAIGGGKQPMQLSTANALLAMGYQFDYVVNVNGWNEIVLASVENQLAGIPAIYPRSHIHRLILEQRTLLSTLDFSECKRLDSLLGFHPAYLLLSYSCINRQRRNIDKSQDYNRIVNRLKLSDSSEPKSDRLRAAIKIWAVSSNSLSGLARYNNLPYLEVIQPTLNHRNSKMLSKEEQAMLCDKQDKDLVSNINFMYSSKLTSIFSSKTNILDSRYIFAKEARQAYHDCVHLNDFGSGMLSQQIVDHIAKTLSIR